MSELYNEQPALSSPIVDSDLSCISRSPFTSGAPFEKVTANELATYNKSKLNVPEYVMTWNALTNVPALASGVGIAKSLYIVGTAGATNLDNTNDWKVNDVAYFDGTKWTKKIQSQTFNFGAAELESAILGADASRSFEGDLNYIEMRLNGAFSLNIRVPEFHVPFTDITVLMRMYAPTQVTASNWSLSKFSNVQNTTVATTGTGNPVNFQTPMAVANHNYLFSVPFSLLVNTGDILSIVIARHAVTGGDPRIIDLTVLF